MTEEELKEIEEVLSAPNGYGLSFARQDLGLLVKEVRSLTTALAVAQGTATAETHRADRAEARVATLEREALDNARAIADAVAMRTSLSILRNRATVLEEANLELANLNRATLHNVEGVVKERDALAKLVVVKGRACRCGGTGMYWPDCEFCGDSTCDHECPSKVPCDDEFCLKARALAKESRRAPPIINPNACAVLEYTADGVSVGRCYFQTTNGRCPRHGDVATVQANYRATGRLTDERELAKEET